MEPRTHSQKNLEDRLSKNVKRNHSAIDFTLQAVPTVKKIAQPLLDFDIRIFTYCRIFDDGKRWYFCNDQSWIEHYFSNHYQDKLEHLQHYIPEEGVKYTLWSEFKTDKIFDTLQNDFNYGHGISMYEKQPHYVDYFDFGSHRDNHDITNFYFNNLGILTQFICFFKEKIQAIFDLEDRNILLTPQLWVPFDQVPRESSRMSARNFTVFSGGKDKKNPKTDETVYFSYMERELLDFFFQGKKTKEIAKILNRLPGTIEYHFDHILHKTGCHTKAELYQFLMKTT